MHHLRLIKQCLCVCLLAFAAPNCVAAQRITYDTIALAHTPAPGVGPDVKFTDFTLPGINDAGHFVFSATLLGTGVDNTNDNVSYVGAIDALRVVARENDVVPGIDLDVRFSYIGVAGLDSSGRTTLLANLTGDDVFITTDRGILSESSEGIRFVARTGSPAPDLGPDVIFRRLEYPKRNSLGQSAFIGGYFRPGVDGVYGTGIFSESNGTLELVVREGEPAPGAGLDVEFDSLTFTYLDFNDAGQVAFRADLIDTDMNGDNKRALFSGSKDSLHMIAREGDHPPGTDSEVTFGFLHYWMLNNAGERPKFPFVVNPGGNVDDYQGEHPKG